MRIRLAKLIPLILLANLMGCHEPVKEEVIWKKTVSCVIEDCEISGAVAGYYAGGIIGGLIGSTFDECKVVKGTRTDIKVKRTFESGAFCEGVIKGECKKLL